MYGFINRCFDPKEVVSTQTISLMKKDMLETSSKDDSQDGSDVTKMRPGNSIEESANSVLAVYSALGQGSSTKRIATSSAQTIDLKTSYQVFFSENSKIRGQCHEGIFVSLKTLTFKK